MAIKAKYIKEIETFELENGVFIENASLGTNVRASISSTSGNLSSVGSVSENPDVSNQSGVHINTNGDIWWQNPDSQVWGTENAGGSNPWYIYKQNNIYVTARKYAGKTNPYAVHIYRPPNISSDSTWGGLVFHPWSDAKIVNHTYRFSFDYRGYSNGNLMSVYQCVSVGWSTLGLDLPTPWGTSIPPFDNWEWQRFQYEFTVTSEMLNFIPGSTFAPWNASTQYPDGYYGVPYGGYVYRHLGGWPLPTIGVTPDQELGTKYDSRYPMTAGYFDVYNEIKIGFTYETQNTRGTHVFIDNIQLEDVTDNKTFKFDLSENSWKSSNLRENTIRIQAVGTALVGIDKGDGGDQFAVEGNQTLKINGITIYSSTYRGLRLTTFEELNPSTITFDQYYDTYAVDSDRTALASKLSTLTSSTIWILTSWDAIQPNNTLDNQMSAMGSVLLVNNGSIYSVYTGGGVRNPYAAVGRGQRVIKEDGSSQTDIHYKRKGVIDLYI